MRVVAQFSRVKNKTGRYRHSVIHHPSFRSVQRSKLCVYLPQQQQQLAFYIWWRIALWRLFIRTLRSSNLYIGKSVCLTALLPCWSSVKTSFFSPRSSSIYFEAVVALSGLLLLLVSLCYYSRYSVVILISRRRDAADPICCISSILSVQHRYVVVGHARPLPFWQANKSLCIYSTRSSKRKKNTSQQQEEWR